MRAPRIGAVLHTWHVVYNQTQRIRLDNLYLGPSYTAEEIKRVLENCKLRFRYILTIEETIETAIAQLAENRIVAWMHGRMEFGPRALWATAAFWRRRSIHTPPRT